MLIAIAAMTSNRIIGKNNTLPRHLPVDLKRFKELTTGKTVVMWRKTYESLPEAFRPLPGRKNIVLSHSSISPLIKGGRGDHLKKKSNIYWSVKEKDLKPNTSLEIISDIQNIINKKDSADNIFIIWWSQIYTALLSYCDRLYITEVKWDYEGDTYFPEFRDQFTETYRESYDTHDFVVYEKNPNN